MPVVDIVDEFLDIDISCFFA
uniref:Uncharacterized protein n=1 Tax=Arundo donax TaxID=35708 RepID=A0A0A8ZNE9_ARUDO